MQKSIIKKLGPLATILIFLPFLQACGAEPDNGFTWPNQKKNGEEVLKTSTPSKLRVKRFKRKWRAN